MGAEAQRLRVRPWRDPRLLVGVLLVLGATVLGARVAAGLDDTVEYWSVSEAVASGDIVSRGALEVTRIRLAGNVEHNYQRVDEKFDLPLDELTWRHAVPAGSLVEKSALVRASSTTRSQLPLTVAEGASPADLRRGDVVDVWVGPGPGDEAGARAVRVLASVRVVQTGGEAAALSGSLAQTVLVDLDESAIHGGVVSTLAAGHVTIVRVT